MANTPDAKSAPQFETAEYQQQTSGDCCKTCDRPIAGPYYRVSGAITCSSCAESAIRQLPKDSHKAFSRGVLFGIGGAIVGLILYSAVGIITGLAIGYVSLAVGYIVGRAMMMGSWGIGGRRYQLAAAAFTYAAVSMSIIPIGISQLIKEGSGNQPAKFEPAAIPPSQATAATLESPPMAVSDSTTSEESSPMGFGSAVAALALFGLFSPLLGLDEPVQGLIGLVILIVGIQIAWKMTAGSKVEVNGPYNS